VALRVKSRPDPHRYAGLEVIGVDLAFATSRLEPPDQLTAWRELINRAFLLLAITPLGDRHAGLGFAGAVTGRELGGIKVWHVRAGPMSAVRERQHIDASGNDDYLLALHVHGTAHALQEGREVRLGPGDFTLIDSRRPYSIVFPGPGAFEHLIYQVPRACLDARRDVADTIARRVPAASIAGQLVSPFLRKLAGSANGPRGDAEARVFVDSGLDLAVSALRSAAGYQDCLDPRRRAAAGLLKDFALAHLGEPSLSPEVVASGCYMSVRQLHRLFAREGLTFGEWVREQRLRRCRDDLTDVRLGHLSVADIAGRWGFRSAAHFSRAFQARYGTTPTSSRRAARAGPVPSPSPVQDLPVTFRGAEAPGPAPPCSSHTNFTGPAGKPVGSLRRIW
jgi:AraC-like DNA-binding protein